MPLHRGNSQPAFRSYRLARLDCLDGVGGVASLRSPAKAVSPQRSDALLRRADQSQNLGGADASHLRGVFQLLQDGILGPLLGIQDPRRDPRIEFVGGIRGTGELQARVDRGEGRAAFALWPTSMGELLAISDAGEIMPPKSTWFEPKLRSGLLLHPF